MNSALLSRDAIVRGLMEQGAPKHAAEAAADLHLARNGGPPAPGLRIPLRDGSAIDLPAVPDPAATIPFPFTITLPWSALVSDNRKYSPAARRDSNGDPHPLLILRQEYRQAKAKARSIAKDALPAGTAAVEIPLELRARVWVPDNRPGHDVANFAKCCHDALIDVVYTDELHARSSHRARRCC